VPTLTSRIHPEESACEECGADLDFDHFTVESADGSLCQTCGSDASAGLGDVAHGLSLIKWALLYDIPQEHRSEIHRHLVGLAELTADLASGRLVGVEPDGKGGTQLMRPGGSDPHATIRRHVMRAGPPAE
jgi:hypothetical protein